MSNPPIPSQSASFCSQSDLLSRWVVLAQINACIHTHCQLQHGYELAPDFNKPNRGIFHLLRKGQCQIFAGNHQYTLRAGGLLYFPRGIDHIIHASATTNETGQKLFTTSPPTGFHTKKLGSRNDAELICGYFDYAPNSLLINQLPNVIQVPMQEHVVEQLYTLLYHEVDSNLPAQKIAIDSLSNYLLISIIRHYLTDFPSTESLLTINDGNIIALLEQLTEHPEKSWTVAHMASYCHLSRAAFAKRFHHQVGLPPNRFLTQVRLNIAAFLLKTTNKSLLDIALSVGFQSESYFGKLFKQHFETTPTKFRES